MAAETTRLKQKSANKKEEDPRSVDLRRRRELDCIAGKHRNSYKTLTKTRDTEEDEVSRGSPTSSKVL